MQQADAAKEETRQRQRFAMECEFVQCLANPDYLQWLARHDYFDDEKFVDFLKYLQYWKRPSYAKILSFPQCLRMLEALQDADFRQKMKENEAVTELKRQQSYQWLYYDQSYADVLKLMQYQI